MTSTIQRLSICLTTHAWNGDRTKVAVCPNNSDVIIYRREGDKLVKETTLTEHDAVITSIDWAPRTNKLLTCSQDRNAYVWNYDASKNVWDRMLVLLRINRAATQCKWSPKEDKFAVASGDKCIAVCSYDEKYDYWVSRHVKQGINSTVLSIAWHPNNILLASGGTDSKVLVHSGFLRGLDSRESVAGGTPFGSKLPFGTLLREYPTGSWIQALEWSPSGAQLAFVCQDSTLNVLYATTEEDHHIQRVPTKYLPFRDVTWVGEQGIIAAGHNCMPMSFVNQGGHWVFGKELDSGDHQKAQKGGALAMWQARTTTGSAQGRDDQTLPTRHQNCISTIQMMDNQWYSTSGLDGNLVIWPVQL